VGITFDASFASARAMLCHVITPLFNCSDNDNDDNDVASPSDAAAHPEASNDAGISSPSTVVAATSAIDAWIVVLGIAAAVMGLYEITTICGSVMVTASATTFTSTVAFTSAVANSSSAACAPHVPTVSLCAPNIASFILNVIDPRVEVVVTFNDVVDSLLFGASIAIPLVLSLATLVRYAARSKQSSTNSYTAEAGPKKLAAPVVTRLRQQLSHAFLAIFDLAPRLTTTRSLRRSLQWMRRYGNYEELPLCGLHQTSLQTLSYSLNATSTPSKSSRLRQRRFKARIHTLFDRIAPPTSTRPNLTSAIQLPTISANTWDNIVGGYAVLCLGMAIYSAVTLPSWTVSAATTAPSWLLTEQHYNPTTAIYRRWPH
jgi:hypothetical protein